MDPSLNGPDAISNQRRIGSGLSQLAVAKRLRFPGSKRKGKDLRIIELERFSPDRQFGRRKEKKIQAAAGDLK